MAYGRAVVAVFPSAMEAALAQGYLEQEGIPSWLQGVMAQAWVGGELPLTGVPLEVAAADLERAARILDGVSGPRRELVEPFEDDADQDPDFAAQARQEAALRSARRGMAAALLALLLMGFVFAAVALAIFANLAVRARWRLLSGKLRALVCMAALWCAALTAVSLVLLGRGERWWWLSGWF